jgi:hypothetical protein
MPPRAPPKSSPLARLLDPRLGMSAVRVVGEAIVTYAHAVVFSPAATPGFPSVSADSDCNFMALCDANVQYPRNARFVNVWCSSGQGKISAFAHLESSLFNSSDLNVRGSRGLRDFIVYYCAVDQMSANDEYNGLVPRDGIEYGILAQTCCG